MFLKIFSWCILLTILEPSLAPDHLSADGVTSTSILVTWSEVPVEGRNGIIISYTVSYEAIRGKLNTSISATKVDAPALQVNLTGLIKDMVYSVRVLASTIKGDGNYSASINIQTNQESKSAFWCMFCNVQEKNLQINFFKFLERRIVN